MKIYVCRMRAGRPRIRWEGRLFCGIRPDCNRNRSGTGTRCRWRNPLDCSSSGRFWAPWSPRSCAWRRTFPRRTRCRSLDTSGCWNRPICIRRCSGFRTLRWRRCCTRFWESSRFWAVPVWDRPTADTSFLRPRIRAGIGTVPRMCFRPPKCGSHPGTAYTNADHLVRLQTGTSHQDKLPKWIFKKLTFIQVI